MKAKKPEDYIVFSKRYSTESIIDRISKLAIKIFRGNTNRFFTDVMINNYHSLLIPQTMLIDLLYAVVKYSGSSKVRINYGEFLELLRLFHNYQCRLSHDKKTIALHIFGSLGEQIMFQESDVKGKFSREKYILENVSARIDDGIDFCKEFYEETGMDTTTYSKILSMFLCYYTTPSNTITYSILNEIAAYLSVPNEMVLSVMNRISCSFKDIIDSNLKRQIFYTKPIINIENTYYLSNPFLLLNKLIDSNYWVIRDKYCASGSQRFINAFGKYFELYAEEVFNNTLEKEVIERIDENTEKRADWKITLGVYVLIIEQKSTLPMISIKQNETDVLAIKKQMFKCWREAIEQLHSTEMAYGLNHPIKIILSYDDYFNPEILDELFNKEIYIENDGYYWLVSIDELEELLYLFKNNKMKFNEIIEDKIQLEISHSNKGRDLSLLFRKHGIKRNEYIREYGIYKEFEKIQGQDESNSTADD